MQEKDTKISQNIPKLISYSRPHSSMHGFACWPNRHSCGTGRSSKFPSVAMVALGDPGCFTEPDNVQPDSVGPLSVAKQLLLKK